MIVKCLNCEKEFDKMPSQVRRSPNHYCCRSCAATVNNKKSPKRLLEGKCCECKQPIPSKNMYCNNCFNIKFDWVKDDMTISQALYKKHHRSSAYALIRSRARAIAKKLGWSYCSKCGYDKHIEIAHVKSISEFDIETKLYVVNSESNLIPLCPNCHWEFDNLKHPQRDSNSRPSG